MQHETAQTFSFSHGRAVRVSLVTETWHPEINGVAHTLGQWVHGLIRLGCQVQVVRPRQGPADIPRSEGVFGEALVAGIPLPMYRALRIGLPWPGQLGRIWAQQVPDIIHVATEGPLGLAALHVAAYLGIPVISSYHSNFASYCDHYGLGFMQGMVARYLRNFHNRTRLCLVPTGHLANRLTEYGYQNVEVLARGVDTSLFNPARRSTLLRREWRATPDTLVVAYVGRLAPEKNLRLVLRSFTAIKLRHPDARLVFVGDGPARRQLEYDFPEHCFTGMRRGIELAEHYASADLFLFPSMTETYGNVVPEALASGLPVLAYDLAAAGELITNDVNGQRVMAGDADAFVKAALALASNRSRLASLRGETSRSVSHLGWELIQNRFAEKIDGILRTCRLLQGCRDHPCMATD